MAGDWIKVEHTLPDKPEVYQLAEHLGVDSDAVVGKLIRFWIWADAQSVDGTSLGVTPAVLDRLTNCPGFSAGLLKVGWLERRNGRFSVPRFDRHNGQTAKSRALTKDRVKRSRNDTSVTTPLPEREETRGDERKNHSSKSDRKPIGSHSQPSDHSPKDKHGKEKEEPLDLSTVDWDHVVSMAESVAKKIPPRTEADRRAWLKYAIMADMTFDENWLMDSTEAVLRSNGTKKSHQAHFVGVLKSKASKRDVDEETFSAMFRRIEIPDNVWHMEVMTP